MAFEWKSISEGSGEFGGNQPASTEVQKSEPVAAVPAVPMAQPEVQLQAPVGAAPVTQEVVADTTVVAAPAEGVDPELPMCDVHNAVVNSTEKSGYNESHDAEVYSSYDTGVNADENAVVA
jgi:hypothetical protein